MMENCSKSRKCHINLGDRTNSRAFQTGFALQEVNFFLHKNNNIQ